MMLIKIFDFLVDFLFGGDLDEMACVAGMSSGIELLQS